VLPNLYIGGFSEEMKVEQLRALNITHVLTINVGEVPAAPKVRFDSIRYDTIRCK